MIVQLINPPYFTLIHKQSGRKFNTFNTEFISYDDEKFEMLKKDPKQEKLIF